MSGNISSGPTPMKPPKSLRQMALDAAAVQASGGLDPWACTRCGCKDWRVAGTYERNGVRRRQRVCRNCNSPMRTLEVPVPAGHDLVVVAPTQTPPPLPELLPPTRVSENAAVAPAERTPPRLPVIPELEGIAFEPEETVAPPAAPACDPPAKKRRKKPAVKPSKVSPAQDGPPDSAAGT